MKKNQIRVYAVLAILLAVFSIIAFVVPFNRGPAFWVAYICGIIAIAAQLYVFQISMTGNAKSKFYGFPIARVGVIYLVAQIVLSIIEMALPSAVPTWIVVIINVVLIAAAAVGCIATDTMRDEIIRQDAALKENVTAMRGLQSLSASIVGQCSDAAVQSDLQRVADELRFSDPVSSDSTAELENEIDGLLREVQRAALEGDSDSVRNLCEKTLAALTERNRLCKLGK